MLLLILLVILMLFFINYVIFRKKFEGKVWSVYLIWWFVLLVLSVINPYNVYPVSSYAYFLLLLNLICSSFGFFFSGNKQESLVLSKRNSQLYDNYISLSRSKMYKILLIIIGVFLGIFYLRYKNDLLLNGVTRYSYYHVGNVFLNSIELYFFQGIVTPLCNFILCYVALSIYFKKYLSITLIFAYVDAFLFTVLGSNRGTLIILALCIFIALLYRSCDNNKKITLSIKKKLSIVVTIVIVLLIVYFVMIYITAIRNGMNGFNIIDFENARQEFNKQIVIYNIGSFRAFSSTLQENGVVEKLGNYNILRGVFYGVEEILFNILKFLGIPFYNEAPIISEINNFLSDRILISNNMTYNALYTSIFYYYIDSGIIGIILYSFTFGAIGRWIIKLFQEKENIGMFFILMFWFYLIMLSNMSLYLYASNIITIIFFVIYKFRSEKKEKNNVRRNSC